MPTFLAAIAQYGIHDDPDEQGTTIEWLMDNIGNTKPMVPIEREPTIDWLMENIGNANTNNKYKYLNLLTVVEFCNWSID